MPLERRATLRVCVDVRRASRKAILHSPVVPEDHSLPSPANTDRRAVTMGNDGKSEAQRDAAETLIGTSGRRDRYSTFQVPAIIAGGSAASQRGSARCASARADVDVGSNAVGDAKGLHDLPQPQQAPIRGEGTVAELGDHRPTRDG